MQSPSNLPILLGGIGLFLFGMALMTSGLKKLTGRRIHGWLRKATGNPVRGALTGALSTAIVQSSSATTLAAIGFVGAGLMTFTQSLGLIFGSNIGTTITGWIVALVGFKFKIDQAALPLLFVAAFLYLFKKRPMMRGGGKALAGFALLFLGLDYLQTGLSGMESIVDLSRVAADHIGGRVLLVLVGILITLITQSSSATVATALSALHTGMLDLPQAIAVVIGADVGTTATAALATIGGSCAARRTGFAHVIYNVMTGIGAFLLVPIYLWFLENVLPGWAESEPELVTVGFHTLFNTLGVLAILPFAKPFGRMIERLLPSDPNPLTQTLDARLHESPPAALDALLHSSAKIAEAVLRRTAWLLSKSDRAEESPSTDQIQSAVRDARVFALDLPRLQEDAEEHPETYQALQLLDHTERLLERCDSWEKNNYAGRAGFADIESQCQRVANTFLQTAEKIGERPGESLNTLEQLSSSLNEDKPRTRDQLMGMGTAGKLTAEELDDALDAARWIRRLAHHAWRIARHWYDLNVPPDPSE